MHITFITFLTHVCVRIRLHIYLKYRYRHTKQPYKTMHIHTFDVL